MTRDPIRYLLTSARAALHVLALAAGEGYQLARFVLGRLTWRLR